jgi:hypothetical protein
MFSCLDSIIVLEVLHAFVTVVAAQHCNLHSGYFTKSSNMHAGGCSSICRPVKVLNRKSRSVVASTVFSDVVTRLPNPESVIVLYMYVYESFGRRV